MRSLFSKPRANTCHFLKTCEKKHALLTGFDSPSKTESHSVEKNNYLVSDDDNHFHLVINIIEVII